MPQKNSELDTSSLSDEEQTSEIPSEILSEISSAASQASIVAPKPLSRSDRRLESANALNNISREELLKFGISRVSDITWFDTIGIPVWKATRPPADVLSVNSGKSLDPWLARAGAIAEAIEFWAMENPVGDNVLGSIQMMMAQGALMPPVQAIPMCRCSLFGPNIMTSWEPVSHLFSDQIYFLPSDMIWFKERVRVAEFLLFQSGSNGGAFADNEEDALITALYELIERDAWTLYESVRISTGKYAPKVNLENAPDPIADALDRIKVAGARVILFDVTTDIGIRTFVSYLFDLRDSSVGMYAGFGTSADPIEAAQRAILESAQSRCCYIDGARDDFARRSFHLLKHVDSVSYLRTLDDLPFGAELSQYLPVEFEDAKTELNWIRSKLIERGMHNLYYKILWEGELAGHDFLVLKAFSLDLEQLKSPLWTPSMRAIDWVRKELPGERETSKADNGRDNQGD